MFFSNSGLMEASFPDIHLWTFQEFGGISFCPSPPTQTAMFRLSLRDLCEVVITQWLCISPRGWSPLYKLNWGIRYHCGGPKASCAGILTKTLAMT